MALSNLEYLKLIAAGKPARAEDSRFNYPPPIAKTLNYQLVDVGLGTSVMEMLTDISTQANPMGTIHGGVLADFADSGIGTAHAATLKEGETFTSIDLQTNFFRPVWNEKIRATTKAVHPGKNVSRYICDITRVEDGKLIAQVTSTVMTLRGDAAQGR